jgi:hypothetical protein
MSVAFNYYKHKQNIQQTFYSSNNMFVSPHSFGSQSANLAAKVQLVTLNPPPFGFTILQTEILIITLEVKIMRQYLEKHV